jgi:hypothetical protein
MLLIDGVKYKLWTPGDEEKEFHPLVKKNYKHIFGEDAIYFDLKQKLSSKSGLAGIPDAYVISLTKPKGWYVVENELSSHDVYRHIVGQVTEFMDLIDELENQRELVQIFCNEIEGDKELEGFVKKRVNTEVFRFLTELLSTQPKIALIVDKITPELNKALNRLNKIANTEVVELQTYAREDAENVQAYLFEPLHVPEIEARSTGTNRKIRRYPKGEITPRFNYRLPILESLIEKGGAGKTSEILSSVYSKMKDKFTPKDLEKLPSGNAIRWNNRARWVRQQLTSEGYMKKDSPPGTWEITNEGKKYLEELKRERAR